MAGPPSLETKKWIVERSTWNPARQDTHTREACPSFKKKSLCTPPILQESLVV